MRGLVGGVWLGLGDCDAGELDGGRLGAHTPGVVGLGVGAMSWRGVPAVTWRAGAVAVWPRGRCRCSRGTVGLVELAFAVWGEEWRGRAAPPPVTPSGRGLCGGLVAGVVRLARGTGAGTLRAWLRPARATGATAPQHASSVSTSSSNVSTRP